MTVSFLDRCIFVPKGAGLADFTVALAARGYLTPAQANAVDGTTYHYVAQTIDNFGNIIQWEVGSGAYTAATATLARTTVIFNSAGNTSKINFTAIPTVMITLLAEDVVTGPTSSTANHATIFSDASGHVLADSNVVLTPPASPATLNLGSGKTISLPNSLTLAGVDGKTLTVNNSLIITGTDGSTIAFGTGGTVLYNNNLLIPKTTPVGAAPGTGFALIQAVAGSIAGTCKIIIYAGTSSTPITIVDNVGQNF